MAKNATLEKLPQWENHWNCCYQMSDFKTKMHSIPPELDLRGPTSKGGKRWERGERKRGGRWMAPFHIPEYVTDLPEVFCYITLWNMKIKYASNLDSIHNNCCCVAVFMKIYYQLHTKSIYLFQFGYFTKKLPYYKILCTHQWPQREKFTAVNTCRLHAWNMTMQVRNW